MATGHILTRHYAGNGVLGDRIYERLRSLGFEERNPLSPEDTAAVDQFHVGGFEATEKLVQWLCPSQGSYVLDVGSGLGGPSAVSCGDLSSSELRVHVTCYATSSYIVHFKCALNFGEVQG